MRTRWIVGLSFLVAGITAVVNAQEKEPLIGTWSLNITKSTFPGPPPQSGTRTFEDAGGGFILREDRCRRPERQQGYGAHARQSAMAKTTPLPRPDHRFP